MKKIIATLILMISIVLLSCCGNDGYSFELSVESHEETRNSLSFDFSLTDEKNELKRSQLVYTLKRVETGSVIEEGDLSILDNSGSLTINGLISGQEYQLLVTCGYSGKEITVFNQKFTTLSGGTKENPFVISTVEDFTELLSENPSCYFELGSDLDFKDVNFKPVFNQNNQFYGSFDGKGYSLKNISIVSTEVNRLSFTSSDTVTSYRYFGVFGYIGDGGEVKNLTIDNLDINVSAATSSSYFGSVAGFTDGLIENVKVKNSNITVKYSAYDCYAGGLVGKCDACSCVKNCEANVNFDILTKYQMFIGGLVGSLNSNEAATNNSYSGNMSIVNGATASSSNNSYIGGLVGLTNTSITDSSVTATISFTNNSHASYEGSLMLIGGLVGFNKKPTNIIKNVTVDSSIYANVLYCKTLGVGLVIGKNGSTENSPVVVTNVNYICDKDNVVLSTLTDASYGLVGIENSKFTKITYVSPSLTFKRVAPATSDVAETIVVEFK